MVLGCSVRSEKSLTNDGFSLRFDVVCTGFLPDHVEVSSISKFLEKILASRVNYIIYKKSVDEVQEELF